MILFFPVLVGTSFSRMVWRSERFTWLIVVTSTLAFLGRSAVWSTALEFRARYFFFWIMRKHSCLVYLREHLNGPENHCTFVSPLLVLVSVSDWIEREKMSISLRRCSHPVLCCTVSATLCVFFPFSSQGRDSILHCCSQLRTCLADR